MPFSAIVDDHSVILTEGAIVERLRRDPAAPLDPDVLHAGFLYEERGREALCRLYRQYLSIGAAADLPRLVGTPTWRANPIRLRKAGLADRDVNGDGVRFLASILDECGAYAGQAGCGWAG
jgi:S-methylmethionine-dependent homocysteine/selenocysteine methylase